MSEEEHKEHHETHHHEKKHKFSIKKKELWRFSTYAFAVLLAVSLIFNIVQSNNMATCMATCETELQPAAGAEEELAVETAEITEKVKLDFYVMSQCPYGTQVEDAIAPVLEKIGDYMDFNLDFIANDNADGTFRSLHGQPEVEGNIVHLCAIKHEPDNYMKLITCMNKNARAIPGNWDGCAEDNNLKSAAGIGFHQIPSF